MEPSPSKSYYIPSLNKKMTQDEIDVCERNILEQINQKLAPLKGRAVTLQKEENEELFKEIQHDLGKLLKDFPCSLNGNYYLNYVCKISCSLLLNINKMDKIFLKSDTIYPPVIGYECHLPELKLKKWTDKINEGDHIKITNLKNSSILTNQIPNQNTELNDHSLSLEKNIVIGNEAMRVASLTADVMLNSKILHSSIPLNIKNIENQLYIEVPIFSFEGKINPDGTTYFKDKEIDLEEEIILGKNCMFFNSTSITNFNYIV